MLGKTSAFLALYVLAYVIAMTSTDARSHHLRHRMHDDDRPRGRRRGGSSSSSSGNNNNNEERGGFGGGGGHKHRGGNHNNHTRSSSFVVHDDTDDSDDDYYYEDDHTAGGDDMDGITVPSLHAMQAFGLPPSSTSSSSSSSSSDRSKQRRPIRGSRKAVVVTKKTYLKKEWCKTQPLKQVIRVRGCLRTKILNNFCYGQCNSFFIPKKATRKGDKGDKKGKGGGGGGGGGGKGAGAEAFMSCGFCRPRRSRWILVTLRCPSKKGLRFKRKRVQYIKKCRCMAQDVSVPSPLS